MLLRTHDARHLYSDRSPLLLVATARARCGRWQHIGGAGGVVAVAVAVAVAVTMAVAMVVGVCKCFMQLTHVGPQRRHLGRTVRCLPPRLTYLS